jgi:polyphosphate kinase
MSFPILDPEHLRRILDDLEIYLQDNVQAWSLDASGTYHRVRPDGAPVVSAQSILLERYAGRSV